MAIQFPNLQALTPQDMGVADSTKAFGSGASVMDTMISNYMKNLQSKELAAKLPFVAPLQQEELTKAQQFNKMYIPDIESQIGLRGAQGNLYGSEAEKNRFMTKNPMYINPDAFMMQRAQQGWNQQQQPQQPSMAMQVAEAPQPSQGAGLGSQLAQALAQSMNANQLKTPLAPPTGGASMGSGQSNLIPGTSIPSTGDAFADNYFAKKYITPQGQANIDLQKALAEKAGAKEIDLTAEENKDLGESAKGSNKLDQSLNQFVSNYNKLNARGAVKGMFPAFSEAAQLTKNASDNIAAEYASLWQKGHVTDKDLNFVNGLKLNRKMNPGTVAVLKDFMGATNERIREEQRFKTAAQTKGIPYSVRNSLWNMYQNQMPIYDHETQKRNNEYRNKSNEYLSNDAISAALSGKEFHPYMNNPEKLNAKDLDKMSPELKIQLYKQMKEKEEVKKRKK